MTSTLLTEHHPASGSASGDSATPRRWSLAGSWQRSIAGAPIDEVMVPGSYPPLGACALMRAIAIGAIDPGRRYFLCSDGVLARARLRCNHQELGIAEAWSSSRFEIPPTCLAPRLAITAEVTDITEAYGPTPGRRFDAGLIRALWIESRPQVLIADVHWQAVLASDRGSARGLVTLTCDGAGETLPANVHLYAPDGSCVATAALTPGQATALAIPAPALWSPTTPHCYRLVVTLGEEERWEERWEELVGIRTLEARGADLWLNGERLLLAGVCRHEFMPGHGYAPPLEAVRAELIAIRRAGFNYVRLVHSPQSRDVVRLASEIGLLVSQEPGTCFHDLGDPLVAGPALAALARLVRRDRNAPAVLAWLIYNECLPHVGYACRAAELCRELDPQGLIACADCSGKFAEVMTMARAARLSFVGLNIYSITPDDYRTALSACAGIPLVLTEWGAGIWSNNQAGLDALCRMITEHVHSDASPRLAGFSYWCWADYEEYSRCEPCAIDGWTIQGLVDRYGAPKSEFQQLTRLCSDLGRPWAPRRATLQAAAGAPPSCSTPLEPGCSWLPLDLSPIAADDTADATLGAMRSRYRGRWPRGGQVTSGGIPFALRCSDAGGEVGALHPLLLGPSQTLTIPVGSRIHGLAVLGHTSFLAGYPSSSIHSVHHHDAEPVRALGSAAGAYHLRFDDGEEVVALRHGLEVLRANAICRWWKLAPRAPATVPALEAEIHPSYEILRIDCWQRRWDRPRLLRDLHWVSQDGVAIQSLYALSLLLAP